MILFGWLGFYYAHFITDGINYVATWGQGMFLAEALVPPIPQLPDWANVLIGMIVALGVKNIYEISNSRNFKRRDIS